MSNELARRTQVEYQLGEEKPPMPLALALGEVMAEFEAKPFYRTPDDLSYDLAYIRSDDVLIMIRRQRPIQKLSDLQRSTDRGQIGIHEGYFVEAFEIDSEGVPQYRGVEPERMSSGLYKRTQISDGFPEILRSEVYFPPTTYDNTRARRYSNMPKFLPEHAGEGQLEGVIGQMFAVRDARETATKISSAQQSSLRQTIEETYFANTFGKKGFSPKAANLSIVIAEEPEDSPLFTVPRELGIETHRITFEEIAQREDYRRKNTLDLFVEENGKPPLTITFDRDGFDKWLRERPKTDEIPLVVFMAVSEFIERCPVFQVIDLWHPEEKEAETGTSLDGWVNMRGLNDEVYRNLMLKIGADSHLTCIVREIAQSEV